jgi:hypothetical protein
MYAKYRIVPRSAIVCYDELRETVRADRGTGDLSDFLEGLWQRHGAPSRAVVDAFLDAARRLDCREAEHPADQRDPDDARRQLLEAWVEACAPRSTIGRVRDHVELALCFVLRRARQYLYAAWAILTRR